MRRINKVSAVWRQSARRVATAGRPVAGPSLLIAASVYRRFRVSPLLYKFFYLLYGLVRHNPPNARCPDAMTHLSSKRRSMLLIAIPALALIVWGGWFLTHRDSGVETRDRKSTRLNSSH